MLAVIFAAALLAGGCGQASSDEAQAEAKPKGYDAQPTIALEGVVAGVVGTGVLVENHSREHLSNVEIVINPTDPSGGFRFRTEGVPANATKTYMAQVFRTPTGDSLNPMVTKVETMAVYADTERGRGQWQGSYRDQY
ncbi:MAG: hypothetical protein H6509_12285 [Bryobacterales bacterium]|nr:hypothetical protein [Acidobacteriota bacterium]MCB9385384.1 hypothetical protein [Bryobacterales bacterium]